MPRAARSGRELDGPPGDWSGAIGGWAYSPAGGDGGVPSAAGGDDGVELAQLRGRNRGVRLAGGQLVVLAAGQVGEPGLIEGVGFQRAQTARQAARRSPGLPWPVLRVRPA
jgi:hypothetical protein